MSEPGHSYRCDYSFTIVPDDAECYCPTPEETAARLPCGHSPEEEPTYQCAELADYDDYQPGGWS